MKLQKKSNFWNKYFPFIIAAVFLILSIILIYKHEFWRDEINSWHLGSECLSFSEFIDNMGANTGHPYSWYAILYLVSHFITDNVEIMKIIHLTISTISVFLFLKFAPFNKIIKIMFIFGYFPFFEYSIISRNYAIGILFMVIFCILYRNRYKNIIPISIILLLMGQANVYAFVISIAFFLFLIFELILDWKTVKENISKIHLIISILIIIAGILLLYWQFKPQIESIITSSDSFISNKSLEDYLRNIYHISRQFIGAYIPIPYFNLNFWGSNLMVPFFANYKIIYLFLLIILMVIPIFLMKIRTIFLYIIGSLVIVILPLLVYPGSLRHFGHFFFIFIFCLWISNTNKSDRYLIKLKDNFNIKVQNVFLIIILITSLVGSSVAAYFDYRYPFSSGKYVAEYIDKNFDKDNIAIVGYQDYAAETVAAYLDKDIYYPNSKDVKKLVAWDKRTKIVETDEIFYDAYCLSKKNNVVLVIINRSPILESEIPKSYGFVKLDKEFNNSIVSSENYYLYILDKRKY